VTALEIVTDVAKRLDSAAIPYVVGGSLSSSAWGQQRQTNDADLALLVTQNDIDRVVAAFDDPYLLSKPELIKTLAEPRPFRSVQLLHMDEAFKVDLFLLGDDEYARSELERARLVPVGVDVSVRFASPENIVIAKLRWFVLGNRVSDRQWNDIVQVLEVQRGKLDGPYLDHWANHFEVHELLEQARSQAYS